MIVCQETLDFISLLGGVVAVSKVRQRQASSNFDVSPLLSLALPLSR